MPCGGSVGGGWNRLCWRRAASASPHRGHPAAYLGSPVSPTISKIKPTTSNIFPQNLNYLLDINQVDISIKSSKMDAQLVKEIISDFPVVTNSSSP